jgi:hypothetical protein
MGRLKRLLSTSELETAQRVRSCSRNKSHKIPKGDRCLVVKESMAKNSYCMSCARLILEKAQDEVAALLAQLPTEAP